MIATLRADMEFNSYVNSAASQEAARPAWERSVENFGSEIIDAFLEASAAE